MRRLRPVRGFTPQSGDAAFPSLSPHPRFRGSKGAALGGVPRGGGPLVGGLGAEAPNTLRHAPRTPRVCGTPRLSRLALRVVSALADSLADMR